ncbi:MAG TPA: hypothetical protein PKI36_06340 [Turneriella sp.]|nr:hypothetical protein [Turneriella sp.]
MKFNEIIRRMRGIPAALLLLSLAPQVLRADIAETFGMGPRMIGTSGAGVANINDWTASFYNMAGVASPMSDRAIFGNQEKSEEASGKIKLLKDDGSLQSDEKGNKDAIDKKLESEVLTRDDKPAHQMGMNYLFQATLPTLSPKAMGPETAKNVDLAKKNMVYGAIQMGLVFDTRSVINTPKNIPIRVGVSLSVPQSAVATVNDTKIESYNFMRYGREAQRMLIIAGVGAQVWRNRLSIGVGANTFTGGRGKFEMKNVEIDPTGNTQVPNAETQMDLTPTVAPVAGVQYRHNIKNRILLVGASWRGEIMMQLDPLDANATTQLLQVGLPLRLAILDFYSPHTFTLGFTYLHDEALKLSLDGELQLWNRFQVNSARAAYMQKAGEYFERFRNIILVRFGAETRPGRYIRKLSDVPLFVRTGFSYTPAFTPDQTGYSNFLDNDKIGYSLGASYFLNANSIVKVPVELIFGFQHQIMLTRTSSKSGDVTSSQSYISGNQPDYTYGGHVIVATLGALMKF